MFSCKEAEINNISIVRFQRAPDAVSPIEHMVRRSQSYGEPGAIEEKLQTGMRWKRNVKDYLFKAPNSLPAYMNNSESLGEAYFQDIMPDNLDGLLERIPETRHIDKKTLHEYLTAYRERYREKLIEMAAEARDAAVSHRPMPFQVGSALLSVNARQEYSVNASHNWTPSAGKREGGAKRCAERNASDAALLSDNTAFIVAITTVSRESTTGDPTVAHDVLHPCQECRTLMRQMIAQGHLSRESVLLSVNDRAKGGHALPLVIEEGKPVQAVLGEERAPLVVEEKTVGEVLDLYADDPPLEEFRPEEEAA